MRASLYLHQQADRTWSWTYEEDGLSLAGARAYPRLEDAVNGAHVAYPRVRIERIEHAPPPRRSSGRRDPVLLRVVAWLLLIVLIAIRLRGSR